MGGFPPVANAFLLSLHQFHLLDGAAPVTFLLVISRFLTVAPCEVFTHDEVICRWMEWISIWSACSVFVL